MSPILTTTHAQTGRRANGQSADLLVCSNSRCHPKDAPALLYLLPQDEHDVQRGAARYAGGMGVSPINCRLAEQAKLLRKPRLQAKLAATGRFQSHALESCLRSDRAWCLICDNVAERSLLLGGDL